MHMYTHTSKFNNAIRIRRYRAGVMQ